REAAEALPGGRGADQDPFVGRVELDAGAVAEPRATGALGTGVHGEHRHRLLLLAPCVKQRREQRRLARAGRSRHADDVPLCLAAERGGGELGQQCFGLLAVGPGGALEQVQRRRGRAQVAFAQALAQFGARVVFTRRGLVRAQRWRGRAIARCGCAGAHAGVGTPLRSPTISTMSCTMRVMSKSFGVYTAATPARFSGITSCSGMIPPTTTGTLTPASRRASITAGISSRCEPERIDRPITCTPSCSAEAAIWAGVKRIPS